MTAARDARSAVVVGLQVLESPPLVARNSLGVYGLRWSRGAGAMPAISDGGSAPTCRVGELIERAVAGEELAALREELLHAAAPSSMIEKVLG